MDNYDNQENDYLPEEQRPKRNNVLIIVLILLLIGAIGFNVYQYYNKQRNDKILNDEVVSTNEIKNELRKQRDSILAQLDEFKGKSAKLDTLIMEKEKELIEKQEKIEKLLKENKISYNKYLAIKDEMAKWKYYAQKYQKDIERLSEENKKLTAQNQTLTTEVKQKKHTIDTLLDVNVDLSNRISLAERLSAQNIEITGVKFKSNNKERETNRSSQLDKIRICFDIPENLAAKSGSRDIYLQILDPNGQTVAIESLGSGVTKLGAEDVQYTTKQTIDYDKEAKNYCIYWGKDSRFEPGKYNLILMTSGYKLGEKSYTIK